MNDSGRFSSDNLSRGVPRKPWRVALLALAGTVCAGIVVLALAALVLTPTLPSIEELGEGQLKVPLRVFGADGNLLAEFGEEKRIPVKIDAVPDLLVKAILAAEDHNFYDHHGVDFLGIARAAWYNLRTKSAGQGASTITMQVARNFFLSPEKTYTRKFKEALLAFKIERELSKNEILELYINKIFLGHRGYGFAAAAQIYYGKTLAELSLPEMAMLAGLPRAPSRDNPVSNPESALERRNYVLGHMLGRGFIEQETYEAALAVPLVASKHELKYEVEAPYVAEMVRQHMVHAYDEKTYGDGFHVYTTIDGKLQRAANQALRTGLREYDRRHGYRGPVGHVSLKKKEPESEYLDDYLKDYRIVGELIPGIVLKLKEQSASVYTQDGTSVEIEWGGLSWAKRYIDENTQGRAPKLARQILRPGDIIYVQPVPQEIPKEPGKGDEPELPAILWELAQIPEVAGALVALRPSDGAVLALTGGFDFYQSSFNRVIQAERQSGSGLKPFIYSAALEKGFTAASTVSGAPIVIEDATLEDEWRPENYSRRFYGPTRLRKALALSLNLVSVRLLRAIGPSYAVNYLERFGFEPNQLPRNLSLALGTASMTPLQMATAFTVFANGGFKIEPYFITRIEDTKHNVLEQSNPAIVCSSCVPLTVDTIALTESRPTSIDASSPFSAGVGNNPVVATTSPQMPIPERNPGEFGPNPAPQQKKYAARVLDPGIAFIMQSLLQEVVAHGTGRAALQLGRKDLAGKTGTTNEYRDAWFSGFNTDLVAITWVGFDQPASLGRGEAGSRAALPIWNDFMRSALQGVPEKPIALPDSVVQLFVDNETGKPADPDDPDAIEEYFVDGSQPGTAIEIDGLSTDTPPPEKIPENIREKLF